MPDNDPMILHSKDEDGRHWLTTANIPPLQIWPVAMNHFRVGRFLATLVSAKLNSLNYDITDGITLTRADVTAVASLACLYPELKDEARDVRIRLIMMNGPEDSEDGPALDDDAPQFMTPQPPPDWTGNYDQWIVHIGRSLGVDVPEPSDQNGYKNAMANALVEFKQRLPALRQRFLAGMEGLNLGFKVGIPTKTGGKENVWVRPTDWKDENTVVAELQSQPRNCHGYKLGQILSLHVDVLSDYAIGSESTGLVEPGFTHRIAEDYGLIIP